MRFEQDVSAATRFGVIARTGSARFLVPNERIQQEAGQRQDRSTSERAAQLSWQRILSSRGVVDLRGMARRGSAVLWSNEYATPIHATQDRGFSELYVKGSVSVHARVQEIKAGGELSAGPIREQFGYRITDPTRFDPGTPAVFDFTGRRRGTEAACFVQDQIRLGHWTINAGIRWDSYRLVVDDRALSPRVAVAWSSPAANLVLRASYDRVFQTPAFENLLLASSDAAGSLAGTVLRLPVPPSRGNFYEAGFSKVVFGALRLDGSGFWRRMNDVADDDLLLNTGVSFPIAFDHASIRGAELKLDVPRWHNISGSFGYSFLRGVGYLPITGGLFLGDEAAALATSTQSFPVTQDQRHTVRSRATYRVTPSFWIAVAHAYGSGLPFEDFDGGRGEAIDAFGAGVVSRVNFQAGRVRPSSSLDVSASLILAKSPRREVRVQAGARNITNRLDVINFAGLFSGTALAPPRTFSVGLRLQFQ
jgi:outer membrane receptor for Fe3+-dicitrate